MKKLVIGTRGSKLALAQTQWIAGQISGLHSSVPIEIRIIRTTGDKLATASLVRLAGETKGLFVKEIEEALLSGSIDLAVHSLKDVPTELPPGLALGSIPRREDPRDALVSPHEVSSLSDLPESAVLGTSSLRRKVQLLQLRPDLEVVELRGNVDTRLRKMGEEKLDGIVLASAGLHRLGKQHHITFRFPVDQMIPAIGQGALGVETREGDCRILELLGPLEHKETRRAVTAERKFLAHLGGGCQVPMGAHAEFDGTGVRFSAFICNPDGGNLLRRVAEGPPGGLEELAFGVSEEFRTQGAEKILREAGSR